MDKSSAVILVTGATGHQGGAVARHLLADGWRVRALVRNPNKPEAQALAAKGAEVSTGNLDDPISIDHTIKGVNGVFSVQNYWETGAEREITQGKTLADAAKAANVEHFIYTSVGGADRKSGLEHFESKWEIEQHIRGLNLPQTTFRPVFFMDNLLSDGLRDGILNGTFAMGISPTRILQMIAVDDIGALVAMAFARPKEFLGKAIEIAGDDVTGQRAAEILSNATGKPVEYVQQPIEQVRSFSKDYAEMYEWFEREGYQADIPALRQLYPQLKTFQEWARKQNWSSAAARA